MTGHYLSPGGGGARIWVADHLIFRRSKGGISRDWETKRGHHWKLWKDSEGDHSSLLGKSRHWGGGERESHQILLGGSLQWSNIQRGDRLNFTLFSLKSSLPLPAINNERSLSCPISLTFNFRSVILYCWSWSTTRSVSPSLLFV